MPLSPLIAVWSSFASWVMLGWGAAALAPILIHLWSRRRFDVTRWAAMEFLLAALQKHARRIRLEQLLLLAIRTSILLLLAVALAEPGCSGSSPLAAGLGRAARAHTVLVIDASYSMAARRGDAARFEAARQLATQVVEAGAQGDGYTLVLLADEPQAVIAEPAFDAADVADVIASLRLTHGGARLAPTLAEVERIVNAVRRGHPRLAEQRVCFFTDLQRTTWNEAASDDVRQRLARLAESAQLVCFDLGAGGGENGALVALDTAELAPTAGRAATFHARVRNFGSTPQTTQLQWLLDGRLIGQERLEVAPEAEAEAVFTHRFTAPGQRVLEAQLADDALPIDNHRWLVLPVRSALRVLCVRGDELAARHVALALEPQRGAASRVRVDLAPESVLLETDLSAYEAIFFCDVARFGRDEAAALADYTAAGGAVVFILGPQTQAASYNEALGEAAPRRILPARLGDVAADRDGWRFDPLGYEHPLVEPFAGHEQAGLLTTPTWRYIRLSPLERGAARTALGFTSGEPAIVEERIGRGRVFVLATAASVAAVDAAAEPPQPWSALAAWPSFPPLVQRLLELAVAEQTAQRQRIVGEPLVGFDAGPGALGPVTIVGPDGRGERVQPQVEGDVSRWSFGPTLLSGVYEARRDDGESQKFAVNVDTRESDPGRVSPDELPSQLQVRERVESAAAEPVLAGLGGRRELFRYCLAGLALLLVAEMLLAWRLGSRTA